MEKITTPRYFRSSAVSAIPSGSVALTYPPPTPVTAQTMIWQAHAGLRFRMVGAYLFANDKRGEFTLQPNNGVTETFLADVWLGKARVPASVAVRKRITRDLDAWDVSTVLVALKEPHSAAAVRLFTEILGTSPRNTQGVAVWRRIRSGRGEP
jgi:hypothetical protein